MSKKTNFALIAMMLISCGKDNENLAFRPVDKKPDSKSVCSDDEIYDDVFEKCIKENEQANIEENDTIFIPAPTNSAGDGVSFSECKGQSENNGEILPVKVCLEIVKEKDPSEEDADDFNESQANILLSKAKDYFKHTNIELIHTKTITTFTSKRSEYRPNTAPGKTDVYDLIKKSTLNQKRHTLECNVHAVLVKSAKDSFTGQALFPFDPNTGAASDGIHGFVVQYEGRTSKEISETMAHELGHVFGALHAHETAAVGCRDFHSSECNPVVEYDPDNKYSSSKTCCSSTATSNNIMSYCDTPVNKDNFSPCQINKMRCFAKKAFNVETCKEGDLRCKDQSNVQICRTGSWYDHSECAIGKFCSLGFCKSEKSCDKPNTVIKKEIIDSCSGFSNVCDESGVQNQKVSFCNSSGITEEYLESVECDRDTNGVSCAMGTCLGGICQQTEECSNTGTISEGVFGQCNFEGDPQCDETGKQVREDLVCEQGKKKYKTIERACSRTTEGQIISTGPYSQCNWPSTCAETAQPQTRRVTSCRNGSPVETFESQNCSRNTDGNGCGGQSQCQNGMCTATCSATDFWTPNVIQEVGTTSNGVQMGLQIAQGVSNGQPSNSLFARVCKNGGNLLNDVHLTIAENIKYTNTVALYQGVAAKNGTSCSDWVQLGYTNNWSSGERLGGFVRIVSPASSNSSCNTNCSNAGCGFCWNYGYDTLTRSCRQ